MQFAARWGVALQHVYGQDFFLASRPSTSLSGPPNVFMPDCSLAAPGWPTFNSADELNADERWTRYFTNVYGGIPAVGYPICIGAFTQIAVHGDDHIKERSKTCEDTFHNDGALVDGMSPCCDPPKELVRYIYNSKNTRHSVPANYWAEIQHVSRHGERGAPWYYLSLGSAVWFNVGNTIVFDDHPDATKFFLSTECNDRHHNSTPHTECEADFEGWVQKAKELNYTSIQFTAHYDCGCGEEGPSSWDLHDRLCQTEIIDVNGGVDTDGWSPHPHHLGGGCVSTYKAGWAAQQECDCNNNKTYSNCQGFGFDDGSQ